MYIPITLSALIPCQFLCSETSEQQQQSDMSELKTKLHRAHSLTKQLERQLEHKNTQLLNLVQENKLIKTNLESDKQRVGSAFP